MNDCNEQAMESVSASEMQLSTSVVVEIIITKNDIIETII